MQKSIEYFLKLIQKNKAAHGELNLPTLEQETNTFHQKYNRLKIYFFGE